MTEHSLIYSVGTQVVAQKEVMAANDRIAHPAGTVGVIVRSPVDRTHAYRVKFSDGFEAPIHHDQLIRLAEFKSNSIRDNDAPLMSSGLYDRVIYRCVIGSRAYGLEDEASDTDRRGIYLPAADLHWSLFGVPEQLENDETQEVYWELQKFIVLALKANPNVLECLYSPIVESATPLGEELLAMRSAFLSNAYLPDVLRIRGITVQKDANRHPQSRACEVEARDALGSFAAVGNPRLAFR